MCFVSSSLRHPTPLMSSSPPPAKRMKADAGDGKPRGRGAEGERSRGLQPHERLLGDWGAPPRVLAPSWLVRTHVALPGVPSPGAVQGNRVALSRVTPDNQLGVYVASNACVYLHTLAWPAAQAPEQGKEGILKPGTVGGGVTRQLRHLTLRSEVQALDCALLQEGGREELLGAVDAYGTLVLARRARQAQDGAGGDDDVATTTAVPRHSSSEGSWAGVALAPAAPHIAATARHLARAVDVYDGDLHSLCIHTPGYPMALTFLPPTSAASAPGTLLAVSEGHTVCIYDIRAAGQSSIASRLPAAHGTCINALAAAPSPAGCALLATAGSERALVVYDCRTARALRRQNGVMRKEVLNLAFSSLDAKWIYASGADNEVTCRRWDVTAAQRSDADDGAADGGERAASSAPAVAAAAREWACRGDARWMGLVVAPRRMEGSGEQVDVMAAWSASGALAAACVTAGL